MYDDSHVKDIHLQKNMNITVLWDVTLLTLQIVTKSSEQHVASSFSTMRFNLHGTVTQTTVKRTVVITDMRTSNLVEKAASTTTNIIILTK
jgi:hypothetical protein